MSGSVRPCNRWMTTLAGCVVCAAAFLVGASAATAQPAGRIDVPPVPAAIEVPAGYAPFLVGHAVGTQNYVCLPSGSGVSWVSVGPQATLFQTLKGEIRQQNMTHFLSPNPGEAGLPRPAWQSSYDSSRAWGRVRASSSDPGFVEPGAIAWLLVEVPASAAGPTGGVLLTQARFIQRLNTSGGAPPVAACHDPTQVGAVTLVPYAADYFFFRDDR